MGFVVEGLVVLGGRAKLALGSCDSDQAVPILWLFCVLLRFLRVVRTCGCEGWIRMMRTRRYGSTQKSEEEDEDV